MVWRLAVLFFLFHQPAHGAPIAIRAGAHDEFTRIVLYDAVDMQWSTIVMGRKLEILFAGQVPEFDIEQIFARIDKRHISNVSVEDSRLVVTMSCDCVVRHVPRSDLLVFDILEKSFESEKRLDPNSLEILPAEVQADSASLNTEAARKETVGPENTSWEKFLTYGYQIPNFEEYLFAKSTNDNTSITMYNFTIGNPDEMKPQKEDKNSNQKMNNADSNFKITTAHPDNKITQTSDVENILRRAANELSVIASDAYSGRCLDDDKFEIKKWVEEGATLSEVISQTRSADFERTSGSSDDHNIQTIRTYLYYGFGLEARQLLNTYPSIAARHPELFWLAEIMEPSSSTYSETAFFLSFEECSDIAAFWAILDSKHTASFSKSVVEGAQRGFAALPLHLKTHLGSKFVNRLQVVGEVEAASAVNRGLELTDTYKEKNIIHLLNSIENKGIIDVSSIGETPATALESHVRAEFQAGNTIDTDTITLIESYITELQDSGLREPLIRILAIALSTRGDFSGAFENISRLSDDEKKHALFRSIFKRLISDSTDIEFVENMYRIDPMKLSDLDKGLIDNTVQRLMSLGFDDLAESVASSGFTQPDLGRQPASEAERVALTSSDQDTTIDRPNMVLKSRSTDDLASNTTPLGLDDIQGILLESEEFRIRSLRDTLGGE